MLKHLKVCNSGTCIEFTQLELQLHMHAIFHWFHFHDTKLRWWKWCSHCNRLLCAGDNHHRNCGHCHRCSDGFKKEIRYDGNYMTTQQIMPNTTTHREIIPTHWPCAKTTEWPRRSHLRLYTRKGRVWIGRECGIWNWQKECGIATWTFQPVQHRHMAKKTKKKTNKFHAVTICKHALTWPVLILKFSKPILKKASFFSSNKL